MSDSVPSKPAKFLQMLAGSDVMTKTCFANNLLVVKVGVSRGMD